MRALDEIAYELIDFVGENNAATVHAHGAQRGNLLRWAALRGQPGLAAAFRGTRSRSTSPATAQRPVKRC